MWAASCPPPSLVHPPPRSLRCSRRTRAASHAQKHFTDAHDRDEDKFKAQRDIRRRFGLMTAFHLLQTVHKQHRMESSKRRLGRKARQSIAQAVAAAAQRKALSAKDVVSRELLQEFLEVRVPPPPPYAHTERVGLLECVQCRVAVWCDARVAQSSSPSTLHERYRG